MATIKNSFKKVLYDYALDIITNSHTYTGTANAQMLAEEVSEKASKNLISQQQFWELLHKKVVEQISKEQREDKFYEVYVKINNSWTYLNIAKNVFIQDDPFCILLKKQRGFIYVTRQYLNGDIEEYKYREI